MQLGNEGNQRTALGDDLGHIMQVLTFQHLVLLKHQQAVCIELVRA